MRDIDLKNIWKKAIDLLESYGFEGYLVGGSLRDFVLGKTPKDWDITTKALPAQVVELFSREGYKVIETGLVHGTVTVLFENLPEEQASENSKNFLDQQASENSKNFLDQQPATKYTGIEITTYRTDGPYSDGRHPDSVRFSSSLDQDLQRRDFTINAMAYNPKTGIIDLYGGINDLENRTIRCVGQAETRFAEDSLRILRGLRFASALGFEIHRDTVQAMKVQAQGLARISKERIAVELTKMLCGPGAKKVILDHVDILGHVLPELIPMKDFDQNTPYHIYDLLTHTAVSLESIAPKPHLRWAMLLHDTGKVDTYFEDEKGVGHFPGHQKVSCEIADQILSRLKFDTATKDRIIALVKYHDANIEPTKTSIKRWLRRLTPQVFFELLQVKEADNLAQSPKFQDRRLALVEIKRLAQEVLEEMECFALKDLKINGSTLIDLGFQPGPCIGEVLNQLLDQVIEGTLENSPEALRAKAAWILSLEDKGNPRTQKALRKAALELFNKISLEVYEEFKGYGVKLPEIRVRNMKTLWGSCHYTKGKIVLNLRLLKKPTSALRYVVVHEYCHFIHPNHSKDFYTLLAKHMPEWKTYKAQLK